MALELIWGTCRNGHRRTDENTATRRDGRLVCKACKRIRDAARRAALREANPIKPRRSVPWTEHAREVHMERIEGQHRSKIEEVEFMLEAGTALVDLPQRLGTTASALARFLYRRDRADLARPFTRLVEAERREAERAARLAA